jgi:hypothetical protein
MAPIFRGSIIPDYYRFNRGYLWACKKPLKNTYSFPLYILSWKIIGIFFQPEKPIMLTITRLVVTKIPITMIFIYPHPFIKEIDYDY